MSSLSEIRVNHVHTIYKNDNGYTVAIYREEGSKNKYKCVGNSLPEFSQITFAFTGEEEETAYGIQFKVSTFKEVIKDTAEDAYKYLSSGIIEGIGKTIARRIVDMFGKDSLIVLKETPEKLLEVKGIKESRLEKIKQSYAEQHLPEDLVECLTKSDFSIQQITKIHSVFPENTLDLIKGNPYELCRIKGISFSKVDGMRFELNIPLLNKKRGAAALVEALRYSNTMGNVGTTYGQIKEYLGKIADIKDDTFIKSLILMEINNKTISYCKKKVNGKVVQYFYLPYMKEAEEKLSECILAKMSKNIDNSAAALSYLSDYNKIDLDDSQNIGVLNCFKYNLSIVNGGPGTGKTTIIDTIVSINKQLRPDQEIFLMAPTGKAARRMTESTGIPAQTIHSSFGLKPVETNEEIRADEDAIIEDALVIIDEFSMVDMMLTTLIFERTVNCRIVIVGDANQLQSVGAGNVLHDLIESGIIPVTTLTTVHRQGEGSTIVDNAIRIKEGRTDLSTNKDFDIDLGITDMTELENKMVKRYVELVKNPAIKSVICLSPYKKYSSGTYAMNNRLQEILNPLTPAGEVRGSYNMTFRIGDPVMHINTNTSEVQNGDTGKVVAFDKEEKNDVVVVEYESGNGIKQVRYNSGDLENLQLAYACTIHKSQGSEYDAVVTGFTGFHSLMLRRNIIYTDITRAKKCVSIFGDKVETLQKMILNNTVDARNTMLTYYLVEGYREMVKPVASKKKSTEIEGQMSFI